MAVLFGHPSTRNFLCHIEWGFFTHWKADFFFWNVLQAAYICFILQPTFLVGMQASGLFHVAIEWERSFAKTYHSSCTYIYFENDVCFGISRMHSEKIISYIALPWWNAWQKTSIILSKLDYVCTCVCSLTCAPQATKGWRLHSSPDGTKELYAWYGVVRRRTIYLWRKEQFISQIYLLKGHKR